MIFLCRNGHFFKTQYGADNCGRCKAEERRRFMRNVARNTIKGVRARARRRAP